MKKNILLVALLSVISIASINALPKPDAEAGQVYNLIKIVYDKTGVPFTGVQGEAEVAYAKLMKYAQEHTMEQDYPKYLTELRALIPFLERNDLIGLVRALVAGNVSSFSAKLAVDALAKRPGIQVNKVDAAGKSALDYAMEAKRLDIVYALENAGA